MEVDPSSPPHAQTRHWMAASPGYATDVDSETYTLTSSTVSRGLIIRNCGLGDYSVG